MPIRYEGEDTFVIERAKRQANALSDFTGDEVERFELMIDLIAEFGRRANESGFNRSPMCDALTVADVIMDAPKPCSHVIYPYPEATDESSNSGTRAD